MRNWLIKLLGGLTYKELNAEIREETIFLERAIESRDNTIEELQKLDLPAGIDVEIQAFGAGE